jgi:hypothetical protein
LNFVKYPEAGISPPVGDDINKLRLSKEQLAELAKKINK